VFSALIAYKSPLLFQQLEIFMSILDTVRTTVIC